MSIATFQQKQALAAGMRPPGGVPLDARDGHAGSAARADGAATRRLDTPFLDCGVCAPLDKLRGLLERWSAPGTRAATILHRRELPVRNSIAHGWHVAARTALLQFGATLAVSLAVVVGFGWRSGLAALAGGTIISAGNVLFALRLFGRGIAPPRSVLRSAWAAEALKWFWLCATLYLAIAVWKLPFAGLIAGVLAAQFAFWIALIATR
ncbi:F0F1-type ATP synthase assembly protein I [Dokdonella fugitiva]|uniref:F0F1-type ATP synthase assembly protein I n=1 Tax=Dokdonella fugitiva TaxID=328517 RepID=A0A839EZJ7_9GAMM|nr:ATP synthase subunit I [Dokdonella fugitiva]MBA8887089.1 F0F1-type ATP synthase assembly protein I [Dokdonella fugitiva]